MPLFRIAFGALCISAALAACGGGGGGSQGGSSASGGSDQDRTQFVNDRPNQADASRFLAQATMGATQADIEHLSQIGYTAWFDEQFSLPQVSHRRYMEDAVATQGVSGSLNRDQFFQSWWAQAVTGKDQLRQRTAYALSQLFVVSFQADNVAAYPRGVASYYDMLGKNAFGNYRKLLEDVSLHPMMGLYLSHLGNRKTQYNTAIPNYATNPAAIISVPDENYAREIMQLFSIGLYKLDAGCNVQTDGNGKSIDTYQHEPDIVGLARVFTGWSWYAGENASDRTALRFSGGNEAPGRDVQPMQAYANFHDTEAKTFLGRTIPKSAVVDPEGDLKIALDTIFNHPNVGCFIGERMIKHFVTSNPKRDYVARVASAFNNNGAGVRGDMKAVLKAVLLDPEARDGANVTNPVFGKLREPVLRVTEWMRAFGAVSQSGRFMIPNLDDFNGRSGFYLGQNPMYAPSVFNYFMPGYIAPNTESAKLNLTAPEFQMTTEVTVAAYQNRIRNWIQFGLGFAPAGLPGREIMTSYNAEVALADRPDQLVERVNLLLMGGTMPADMKTELVKQVNSVVIPKATATNQTQIDNAKLNRVWLAVYYTMGSPAYLVQK